MVEASLGHVSFGGNRHLVNGFGSCGATLSVTGLARGPHHCVVSTGPPSWGGIISWFDCRQQDGRGHAWTGSFSVNARRASSRSHDAVGLGPAAARLGSGGCQRRRGEQRLGPAAGGRHSGATRAGRGGLQPEPFRQSLGSVSVPGRGARGRGADDARGPLPRDELRGRARMGDHAFGKRAPHGDLPPRARRAALPDRGGFRSGGSDESRVRDRGRDRGAGVSC